MKFYALLLSIFLSFGFSAAACGVAEGSADQVTAASSLSEILLASSTDPRTCLSNSDCVGNETCIRGRCEMNGGPNRCNSDYDCHYNSHCHNGACVP